MFLRKNYSTQGQKFNRSAKSAKPQVAVEKPKTGRHRESWKSKCTWIRATGDAYGVHYIAGKECSEKRGDRVGARETKGEMERGVSCLGESETQPSYRTTRARFVPWGKDIKREGIYANLRKREAFFPFRGVPAPSNGMSLVEKI